MKDGKGRENRDRKCGKCLGGGVSIATPLRWNGHFSASRPLSIFASKGNASKCLYVWLLLSWACCFVIFVEPLGDPFAFPEGTSPGEQARFFQAFNVGFDVSRGDLHGFGKDGFGFRWVSFFGVLNLFFLVHFVALSDGRSFAFQFTAQIILRGQHQAVFAGE